MASTAHLCHGVFTLHFLSLTIVFIIFVLQQIIKYFICRIKTEVNLPNPCAIMGQINKCWCFPYLLQQIEIYIYIIYIIVIYNFIYIYIYIYIYVICGLSIAILKPTFFFVVLVFELRTSTSSHSTSPVLCWIFSR
jgi:hypothetical protein